MADLLQEIVGLTRVVTNASSLRPGDALTVDVIPQLGLPVPVTGLPSNALEQVPLRIAFQVQRRRRDGSFEDVSAVRIPERPVDTDPGDSAEPTSLYLNDLLSVAFRLLPSLDFGTGTAPLEYQLVVHLAAGEGTLPATSDNLARALIPEGLFPPGQSVTPNLPKVHRRISIPVPLPPLSLPALAVMSTGPWFEAITSGYANASLVMTPTGDFGPLPQILGTYNNVLRTLETLRSAVGVTAGLLGTFLSFAVLPLTLLTKVLSASSIPPSLRVGMEAPDFNTFGGTGRISGAGFDNEPYSLLMIAPTDLGLKLYNVDNFHADIGDEQFLTFKPVDIRKLLTNDPLASFIRNELLQVAARAEGEVELPPRLEFDPETGYPLTPEDLGSPTTSLVPVDPMSLPDLGLGVICIGHWNRNARRDPPLTAEHRDMILGSYFKLRDEDTDEAWIHPTGGNDEETTIESARWTLGK